MELTLKNLLTSRERNCPICNYEASCPCKYQTHIVTHKDPFDRTLFKCFFCDHRVMTLLDLREHMFTHGDSSEKLKCFVCNVFCKSDVDFKNHIWLHQGIDKQQALECVYCDHETSSVISMKMHMLKHKNSIAVQECCLCHYKSKSKGDLLRHFVSHKESPSMDSFICNFCEYETKHLSALKLHLSSHRDKTEVIKCSACDYAGHSKVDFAKHVLIHRDPSILDYFKCYFCEYVTNYFGTFRLHIFTHNRCLNSLKLCKCRYNCHLCDYKTELEYIFVLHWKQSHTNFSQSLTCIDGEPSQTSNHSGKEYFPQNINFNDQSKTKLDVTSLKSKLMEHLIPSELLENNDVSGAQRGKKDGTKDQKHQCAKCSFSTMVASDFKLHKKTHKQRSKGTLFHCTSCGSSYKSKKSLNQHIKRHTKEKEKRALHCDRNKFNTLFRNYLDKHIDSRHIKKIKLPPNSAGSNVAKIDHVKSEQTQHSSCASIENVTKSNMVESTRESFKTNEKISTIHEYQCDECSFGTNFPESLKRHKESHKDRSERKLFHCASCSSSYTSKASLKLHTLQHIDLEDRPMLQCEKCEFRTIYRSGLKKHFKAFHLKETELESSESTVEIKTAVYKCRECPFETNFLNNLKRHNETHKNRSERQLYNCVTCSAAYTSKTALTEHIFLQHMDPDKGPKLQCRHCKYTTTDKLDMKSHRLKHIVNHSEGNPFDCSTCGATLRSKSSLKRHTSLHMDPKDRPMLHCERCKYKTMYRKYLNKHIKSNHLSDLKLQLDSPELKAKNTLYECKGCSYQTKYIQSLKRHEKTHMDRSERELYECAICGITFVNKGNLKSHILSQHMDANNRVKIPHGEEPTAQQAAISDTVESSETHIEPKNEPTKELEHVWIKQETERSFAESDIVKNLNKDWLKTQTSKR